LISEKAVDAAFSFLQISITHRCYIYASTQKLVMKLLSAATMARRRVNRADF
jgi:hypothetical protein